MSKKTFYATLFVLLMSMLMTMLCGCGRKSDTPEIPGSSSSDAPVSTAEPDDLPSAEVGAAENLSDEQALSAVKNYCYKMNPDLERIVNTEGYSAYWEISSSDEHEIVVLFGSYTGAQNRYYIDRTTGDTYVTEYAPGITSEEQRTNVIFNIRDFF